MSKTKALRRATALALSAALALSVGYADEPKSKTVITAPNEWSEVIIGESENYWESPPITVIYTIPAGTDASSIVFPISNWKDNIWTWVPSDSGTLTIKIIDQTGNYEYDSGSLSIGTKEPNFDNERETIYRAYNSALYNLINIQNLTPGDGDDIVPLLFDEPLSQKLQEHNANYINCEDYLDDYYCDFYNVESLNDLSEKQIVDLFSGRFDGTINGPDTTGKEFNLRESNSEVLQVAWDHLYRNLFKINGNGVLTYESESSNLNDLDSDFAANVKSETGEQLILSIDGPGTRNAYQNHDLFIDISFSMSLPGTGQTPDPDPDPGDGDDEEPYDGPELTIVKVDEEGETITSPATFHIYKEQGDKVLWRMSGGRWSEDEEDAWSYTTRDGETTCYDLKPGTYYIVEISAPEGYDLAEEPLEVEVESRDVTVEFVNSGDGVVTTPTKPVPDTGR